MGDVHIFSSILFYIGLEKNTNTFLAVRIPEVLIIYIYLLYKMHKAIETNRRLNELILMKEGMKVEN